MADVQQLQRQLARLVIRAREDPVEFVRLVGRTEQGHVVRMADMHIRWQRALSTHRNVVIFAAVGHGKSQQLRWRLEWELGRNPNLRIGIISAAQDGQPSRLLSAIKADIEHNATLKRIFPHLRPSTKEVKWSETAITVERPNADPNPSIQIFGTDSRGIQGARLDLILFDDLCNGVNTLTPGQRDKVHTWVVGTVLARQARSNTRVVALANTWHRDDAIHRLAKIPGYHVIRDSAFKINDDGVEVPAAQFVDAHGKPAGELWTMDELRKRERELGPILGPMMLRLVLPADLGQRIKEEWIEKCLNRGRGVPLVVSWDPMNAASFTGVDLSVTGGGDLACLFTAAVLPDGSRRILDIRSGRWTGPQITQHIDDVWKSYGSSIRVESNAAQLYLRQFSSALTKAPINDHYTGKNKHYFQSGVESIANELSESKWIIPCNQEGIPTEEVAAWIREMLTYNPKEHTGDRLMASWICREEMRIQGAGVGGWSVEDPDWDTLAR